VFALRLSGPGGRSTFGVRTKTLTCCLTPPIKPTLPPPADIPTSNVPTINPGTARTAILAADPTISGTLLQRKRPTFGRFGDFPQNGLPAVSEVSPTRIASKGGPAFDVNLGAVNQMEI